mgnify:CR=1 FL=1
MPRYSTRKRAGRYKALRSTHQASVFLGRLSNEQWKIVQDQARTLNVPHVHPQAFHDLANNDRRAVMMALHLEHKAARKGHNIGGGLFDALGEVGKWIWDGAKQVFRPIKAVWNIASNLTHPLFHGNSISDHTRLVASAITQSYVLDESQRADYVGDLIRDQDLSSEFIDVWTDTKRDPPYTLITVRGSATAQDFLVDDTQILATGNIHDNRISGELGTILAKYGDSNVEIAGHSLGTTLIAKALSENGLADKIDTIDFFNPASTPLTDSIVSEFGQDEKAHFFMNMSDFVGWGAMMDDTPVNLTMNNPKLNPADAHSISQWVDNANFETGQLEVEGGDE